MCSVFCFRKLHILNVSLEDRYEKRDVKLVKYVDHVFGQIFTLYVIGWLACGDL